MSMRSFTLVPLLFSAAIAACNDHAITAMPAAAVVPPTRAAATLEWQEVARNLVAANRLSPLATGRVLAALGLAQYQAAADVDGPAAELQTQSGNGPGGRALYEARRGAVAGAAAQVLTFFFRADSAALAQRVAQMGEAGPGDVHPEFTRGVALGRVQGEVVLNHVRNDGFTRPWQGPAPTGAGIWTPGALPPAGGTLGAVTPYFLTSGSQFRPAAPPVFGTPAFTAAINEVVTTTVNRTPPQLLIAQTWDYAAGSPTPVGFWNKTAAQYVAANQLDELAAARVFALTHTAVFDALIGCWDAKYFYWTIRPYQASASVALALGAPNHPSYPSGHSCVSASAGRVLATIFPEHTSELDALVTEAGMSRVYAGIHYMFDVTAGQQLGRSVADWTIARAGF
jgi:membrane-associated phospholipid phosphatase